MRYTFDDYIRTCNMHDAKERCKVPGQRFCDKYGWRLHEKYRQVQRPDKITYMNGSIYRTHTPVVHVWYQNIKTPSHHVWVEFSGVNSIIVKSGIDVVVKDAVGFNKYSLVANPDNYNDITYFYDGASAVQYILSLCK